MNQNIEGRVAALEQTSQQIVAAINQVSVLAKDLKSKMESLEIKVNDLAGRDVPQVNFDESIPGALRNLQQEIVTLKQSINQF